MKRYTSWDQQQSSQFLEAYDKTEPRSSDRRALLKAANIDPKNSTQAIVTLRRQAARMEQAALAIPEPKNGSAKSAAPEGELSPSYNINSLPADDPRVIKTKELRTRIVREWLALPRGSQERRDCLAKHGIQAWQASQWATALGLVPGSLHNEPTKKNGTSFGPGRVVTREEVAKRKATRELSSEEKLAITRKYMSLPQRDGSRSRLAEEKGIALSALARWAFQYKKGLRPASGTGRNGKPKRLAQEEDVEELSGEAPAAKETRKVPYADLLQQNVILKGLLNMAESQGFDLKSILKFGK